MEQRYHFIRNTIKLLGITLAVYAFMKWILPMVFPFFAACYVAVAIHGAGKKKKDHPFLLAVSKIVMIILILAFLWYMLRELQDLWACREQLFRWDQTAESGVVGKVCRDLTERFDQEEISRRLVDNIMSPLGGVKDTFGGMVTVAVTAVAVILILKDYDALRQKVEKHVFGKVVLSLGKDLAAVGGDYLRAQGIILMIVTGICVAALALTGNKYAVLAGVLIGICDALPFIGTALVFVPWALLMFMQKKIGLGIWYLFLAAGTSLLRQYLEPKLIGKRVGADPLLVLFCIYMGLQVYGIWGVVLGPASAFLIWEIYRFT